MINQNLQELSILASYGVFYFFELVFLYEANAVWDILNFPSDDNESSRTS